MHYEQELKNFRNKIKIILILHILIYLTVTK